MKSIIIWAGVTFFFASGCSTWRTAYNWIQDRDDDLAQQIEIIACALPTPAKIRNYRPEQIIALDAFCGFSQEYIKMFQAMQQQCKELPQCLGQQQ